MATDNPAQWLVMEDDKTGKSYYYNTTTKKKSFTKPDDYVEPEWVETLDKSTGKKYYFNRVTKKTSWKKPRLYRPISKDKEARIRASMETTSDTGTEAKKSTKRETPGGPKKSPTPGGPTKRTTKATPGGPSTKSSSKVTPGGPSSTAKKEPSPKTHKETPGSPQSETAGGPKKESAGGSKKQSTDSGTTDNGEKVLWKESKDKKTGKLYYFHKVTKETRWKRPDEYIALDGTKKQRKKKVDTIQEENESESEKGKGDGPEKGSLRKKATSPTSEKKAEVKEEAPKKGGRWKEVVDGKTGKKYFYHTKTKETSWKKPKELIEQERLAAEKAKAASQVDKEDSDDEAKEEKIDDIRRAQKTVAELEKEVAMLDADEDDDGDEFEDELARLQADVLGPTPTGTMRRDVTKIDPTRRAQSVVEDERKQPAFNMNIDVFFEAFKVLPKTTDEALLIKRLRLLDVSDPEADDRVKEVINMRKGMFYQLIRVLKKYSQNAAIVTEGMKVLKKFGSLEDYVIKAVENDIVGRTIAVLTLHMSDKTIVGDCIILLGNLALNEYVKELIRMEEGVKVISLLMVHPEHVDDPVILDKCCYCLANLAVDNVENVKDIIHGGALKSVIVCMDAFKEHEELLDSGTVVLSNLCAGADKQRKPIAQAGAVKALVGTILFAHNNMQVLHDCLRALGNLALQEDTIPFLLKDGAVGALVTTLKDHETVESIVTLAISVLGNLSAFCTTEQTEEIVAEGTIESVITAAKAHPESVDVQNAMFGALSNFAKVACQPESPIDKSLMDTVPAVVEIMKLHVERKAVVSRGVKLLSRISTQDHRTKVLVSQRIHVFLSVIMKAAAENQNGKLVRDVLQCITTLANEVTSPDLVNSPVLGVVTKEVLTDMVDDSRVVEATLKCLRGLVTAQAAALKVGQTSCKAIVSAGKRHRDQPGVVEKIGPLLGSMSIFKGTMKNIVDANGGSLLMELLEEHANNPDLAYKLIAALTNMMSSQDLFAQMLKAAQADRVVRPILDENGSHVHLRTAVHAFLQKLNDTKDLDSLGPKKYDDMTEEQKNTLLKSKFYIPTVNAGVKNFLTAGQQLMVHFTQGAPAMFHVYTGDNARFLELREQDAQVSSHRYPLRTMKSVTIGCEIRALQRNYKFTVGAKQADPMRSLGVTMEDDNGEEVLLGLECADEADRDRWAESLRDVIRYRKELVDRRSELTEEEKAAYY